TAEVAGTGGAVQSDSFSVGIQRPPKASFTYSINGQIVSFTDTSTGSPTAWRWKFGDGNTSTQQNPVHQYVGTGPFTPTLTVSKAVGDSAANAVISLSGGA